MANGLVFDTALFAAALERASEAVLSEIRATAEQGARDLAGRVVQAYPRGATGNLRAGVTWQPNSPRRGLGAYVRSNAPHVHFIETGRPGPGRGNQHATKAAKGTSVIFVPLAIQAREQFYQRVQAILNRPTEVTK